VPALTIKAKGEGSILEPVTLGPLLVPFKEVKGLNIKILCNLFLFRGKVPKANKEDSKSDKSMSLEDIFIASSSQKYRARKAFKKSPKKKLKIGPTEPLASSKANR
jgi:3-polyprenyl-4-hydroxybenzoate decarboxylase